ncbi:hypothetical protein IMZ31_23340 (plasmid) [Pontibacillus sp. ALD_SL1]|nr:hypothetical protein [Pontibacillus sp. ALD_SL1]QST02387.1 hypothetical protein IMZ31_23340 [Pontibacillus sp. ALD_SL1]
MGVRTQSTLTENKINEDIYVNGQLIAKKGTVITDRVKKRLHNWGI